MTLYAVLVFCIVFALILSFLVYRAYRWVLVCALVGTVLGTVLGITMTSHLVHLS